MAVSREDALAELYRRGKLDDSQRIAVEELARRGRLTLPSSTMQEQDLRSTAGRIPDEQDIAFQDIAGEVGPVESFLIGTGRGLTSLARGVGLAEPEDESATRAIGALKEQRPYTMGAGEIIGQAAPFVPLGAAAGAIPSLAGRVAAGGALGAAEGGIIASAEGKDVASGAGLGLSIGAGAEILFPVIGRLGRAVYQRVKGVPPKGALLTADGMPSSELQSALSEAGLTMDDLVGDAKRVIENAKAGSDPRQVVRSAEFEAQGVPISQGELTQDFSQQAQELRLLESASDATAEPFRQFKLRQSEAIRKGLQDSVNINQLPEETGTILKEALTGQKKLLRTQKNDLYRAALENASDAGGIPLFTDDIASSVADARTIKRLDRVSGGKASDVLDTLAEFGIIARDGVDDIEALSVANFEDLRQALKGIERADQTGAVKVLTGRVIDALDNEIDNVVDRVDGLGEEVLGPLKEARKLTRELKTDFSPQSVIGQLIDVKRDGVTPVVEASKVYSKLTSKGMPIENVRRTVANLLKSGDKGKQAMADLQTTTLLDLVDSGFSTASRQIDGIPTFNYNTFNRRIDAIGEDRLKEIFKNNPEGMKKIKSFQKIAKTLQPPAGAIPKGSASVIGDALNRLGILAVTAKVPGGGVVVEGMQRLSNAGRDRRLVDQAMAASPDVRKIAYTFDETFPGIAAALGISGISVSQDETSTTN